MKKTTQRLIYALAISALMVTSCQNKNANQSVEAEPTLYQVSTIQALTAGYYYPVCTVGELLSHGNFGIGTFEAVDGEMIVLDGVCYRAKSDGTVAVVSNEANVPFASVANYEPSKEIDIQGVASIDSLKTVLAEATGEFGTNHFLACRIDGKFPAMHVRSEEKSPYPYIPFAEWLKTAQRVFEYTDQEGTLVALYCPAFAKEYNVHGWHIHFISSDKARGGHVLDLAMESGHAGFAKITNMSMKLPNDTVFKHLELGGQAGNVAAAESGKVK